VQLDVTSRALLMKMLDDCAQQTLLKQAKVISPCLEKQRKYYFSTMLLGWQILTNKTLPIFFFRCYQVL
jgi:hypothetical protein